MRIPSGSSPAADVSASDPVDASTGSDNSAQPDPAETTEAAAPERASAGLRFENRLDDTLGRLMLGDAVKKGRQYAGNTSLPPRAGSASAQAQGGTSQVGFQKLAGVSLGENQSHQDVKVKREIGAPEGYDDKLQAVAVARMSHADPAAVVRVDGKWHAVETTAQMEPTHQDGAGTSRVRTKGDLTFEALPPYADVKTARDQVASLRQKFDDLDRQIKDQGSGASQELKSQRGEVLGQLQQARRQLAGTLFGADDSDIQFNTRPFNDTPGKINIDPYSEPNDPLGEAHPEGRKSLESGAPLTFGIKLDELENPDAASGVVFHEVTHMHDMEMTQKWVHAYTQETGRPFVSGGEGRKLFQEWMQAQTAKNPPRLSNADAEMVVDEASEHDLRTSEAHARVAAAVAAVQAGAPQVAREQLVNYAKNTHTDHHPASAYQNPQERSVIPAELTREMGVAYQHMSKDQRQQFRDAIAAAKAENPESWLAKIHLPN